MSSKLPSSVTCMVDLYHVQTRWERIDNPFDGFWPILATSRKSNSRRFQNEWDLHGSNDIQMHRTPKADRSSTFFCPMGPLWGMKIEDRENGTREIRERGGREEGKLVPKERRDSIFSALK